MSWLPKDDFILYFCSYLGKVPGDAFVLCLCPLYPTLEPAVGEGVAVVEIKIALVSKETVSGLRCDASDLVGGYNGGREVDEMLAAWSKLDPSFSHHRELVRLTDEETEGSVPLVKSAKGHRVRVQIQTETQTVLSANLGLHLLRLILPLHLFYQPLVLRLLE